MSRPFAPSISIGLTAALLLAVSPTAVSAHWEPGDSYKMHFPQLPDPFGWDVEISSFDNQHECADDWVCTETGPVDDIHFWYSVANDGQTQIDWVVAMIYADDPIGFGGDPLEDPFNTYSKPLNPLWAGAFSRAAGDFTVVDPAGTGEQGFFDPQQPAFEIPDHFTYQQLNIPRIDQPFTQEAGTVYWLGLYVYWDVIPQEPVGWKTSQDHFLDQAVYRDINGVWQPLFDPVTGEVLDFAFVITPEPATLWVLAAGGLVLSARRRG